MYHYHQPDQRVVIGGIGNDGNGSDSGDARVYERYNFPKLCPSTELSFIPSYSQRFVPALSQNLSSFPSNDPSAIPSLVPSLIPSVIYEIVI